MPNITIFVPAFGGQISAATVRSLMALGNAFAANGIGGSFTTESFPDIAELRNMVLTLWYDAQPQSDYMLMVDADMGFSPQLVLDMIKLGEPLTGAVYPKKTIDREWVVSGDPAQKVEVRDGFLKCLGIGCGVMLIRRDAVTDMIKAYPETVSDHVDRVGMADAFKRSNVTRIIRLFDTIFDPKLGRISEDLSFCRRWTDLGNDVWGAIHHRVEHVGMHSFIGSYGEEVGKPRTAPEGFRVVGAKHGQFRYNPNDTFIGRSLEHYGEWTEFEIELLSTIIKPGDVVLDVGANIGTHTVPFSKMVGPDGTVYAFEAQPRLFDLLKDNVCLNKLENVKGICGVVGQDKDESMMIPDLPPDSTEFNFGAQSLFGKPGRQVVPVDTIDALELERCDVIKIDVEGMEAAVLRGAHNTIFKFEPVLYIENNGPDSAALWDVLDLLGYKARWSMGPYFNPGNFRNNPESIWPGVVPSANVIAIHESLDWPDACRVLPPLRGPEENWQGAGVDQWGRQKFLNAHPYKAKA